MDVGTQGGVQSDRPPPASTGAAHEPHPPVDRLDDDGTWVLAPCGSMRFVEGGERVVCHVRGEAPAVLWAQNARRHGRTLVASRERFGLNRRQSLLTPALSEVREVAGTAPVG